MEILLCHSCDRIDLRSAADAKGSDTAKECEQEAQPFHVKASLQGIHSAALHTSVSGLHAVLDSDKRLRIFCGNTEYAGKPAPQNSTGTAKGDCRSDTDDITGTDRCGKRGCQRAE